MQILPGLTGMPVSFISLRREKLLLFFLHIRIIFRRVNINVPQLSD